MRMSNIGQKEVLTASGIALVVTQLFRLLFGGYLIGFDLYHHNDLESALTVLLIYVVIGVLTALFLIGKKKAGLIGLIALSVVLLVMETLYVIVYVSTPSPDPSWHNPLASWWALVSNYLFPLITLVLTIKVYKE
jgi:UDP-N-acetylmuramyl pentapeptide phosphotransferase/UDP-N-acetylglucosamine-1-phosphate transferase